MTRDLPVAPVRPVPSAQAPAGPAPAGAAGASAGPDRGTADRPAPVRPAPVQPAAVRPAAARPAAARPPVYRGLPGPVRVAAWAVFAVAAGGAAGSTAPNALRGLGATLALQPAILPWYSVRALGFLAYLAYAASVIYGLMLSTKLLDAIAHRPVSVTLHKDLAIAGTVLSVLHGALLLADRTFAFTPAALLVPFRSPYAPVAVAAGQIGFYLMAAITVSFYVRRRIGQRTWRLLHYLTFAGFVAVAAHGVASGTDTSRMWAFAIYVAPAAIVVFLFAYRVTVALAAYRGAHPAAARGAVPVPSGGRAAAAPSAARPSHDSQCDRPSSSPTTNPTFST